MKIKIGKETEARLTSLAKALNAHRNEMNKISIEISSLEGAIIEGAGHDLSNVKILSRSLKELEIEVKDEAE
jgi:hypothetical protein